TPAARAALERGAGPLSGTAGAVLDPIFSLRQVVVVPPGGSATLAFSTALADTREEALALADQFHALPAVTRAFELAWAHSRVELRHLNLSVEEAQRYQSLAGQGLLPRAALRAPAEVLAANRQGQEGLWRHGISGDLPILVVKVADPSALALVRQLLAAHTYWRARGLAVDLVILNERPASYRDEV